MSEEEAHRYIQKCSDGQVWNKPGGDGTDVLESYEFLRGLRN